jgi:hypothetical protein
MGFQSTVFIFPGFGVQGEVFQTSPQVILSYILESSGTPNVIGATAYTITSQGIAQAGSAGTLGFGGILVSPKEYALFGSGLTPSLTLADQTQAELMTEGLVIVRVPAACAIGDYLIYNDTTGALATMSPGNTCPTGYSFANGVISQFTPNAVGSQLAVAQLSPVINPIPANA